MRDSEAPTHLKRQVLDLVAHLLGEGSDSLGQPLDSPVKGRRVFYTLGIEGRVGTWGGTPAQECERTAIVGSCLQRRK